MPTATTVPVKMAQRRDTAANWTSANPTLLAGEIGIESDTNKIKLGDGSTAWTSLAYTPWSQVSAYPLVNADIAAAAGIVDTKLATIATALKVSNSATTAASANTASAIVARDASGNFTAGTITAALTGAASSNVLKAGDTMTGALVVPLGAVGTPSLTFTGDLNTGIYSPGADQVAVATNGVQRLTIDTAATTSTLPVVHPLGAVGTPSITFTGDLNTGIWSPAADTIAASTGGSERLRITSAGLVGIGTSSPAQRLHLSHQTTGGTTSLLVSNPDGAANATTGIKLGVSAEDNSVAKFAILHERFNSYGRGDTYFCSNFAADTTEVTDADAVITIKGSTKTVGIGTTSPVASLHVENALPTLVLGETDGTSTHSQSWLLRNSNELQIQTRNSTGTFVSIDYNSAGSSTGATSHQWYIQNSERARIDASGRLLVGTSTARSTYLGAGVSAGINVEAAGSLAANNRSISIVNGYSLTADGDPIIYLGRTRSDTIGGTTVVQSSDAIGRIAFVGSDGTNMLPAAQIRAEVDGTPGANDMPGRLVFSTTADGAASPTEALRITNDRVIAYNQPTPTSKSAAATLTITELKTGIIQYTGAVATLTLPTGTLMEGGFSGIYTNMAFEWSVINTGAGICTVAAGTDHTVIGSGTVAIGASARFVSRRTAANTFVSYCLS